MKYLKMLLIAGLLGGSFSAFAGRGYMKFWLRFNGPTEAAVVATVDSHLPAIQDGTYEPFRRELESSNCWPIRASRIEVIDLNVVAKYRRNRQTGELEKYYRGTLAVWHKSCEKDDD